MWQALGTAIAKALRQVSAWCVGGTRCQGEWSWVSNGEHEELVRAAVGSQVLSHLPW